MATWVGAFTLNPLYQRQQVIGHGAKGSGFLALGGDSAGYDALFMHVQPTTPFVENLHLEFLPAAVHVDRSWCSSLK
jgi:hypothetical protein